MMRRVSKDLKKRFDRLVSGTDDFDPLNEIMFDRDNLFYSVQDFSKPEVIKILG